VRITCSFWFTLCPEAVIEGLDRAVLNMKKGEVALVTIPPEYTEPKQDLAIVPANSTVIHEVELLSFVKVGFSLKY
jgi:FK506-binding protein 4/5